MMKHESLDTHQHEDGSLILDLPHEKVLLPPVDRLPASVGVAALLELSPALSSLVPVLDLTQEPVPSLVLPDQDLVPVLPREPCAPRPGGRLLADEVRVLEGPAPRTLALVLLLVQAAQHGPESALHLDLAAAVVVGAAVAPGAVGPPVRDGLELAGRRVRVDVRPRRDAELVQLGRPGARGQIADRGESGSV